MAVQFLIRTLARKWDISPAAAVRRLRQSDGTLALQYQGKLGDPELLPIYSLTNRPRVPYLRYQQHQDGSDELPNLFIYSGRSELLTRLLADECEYCEDRTGPFEVHHVRKLKDLAKGVENWKRLMIERRRKTLVLCFTCHRLLHAGRLPDWRPRARSAVKADGEPDA